MSEYTSPMTEYDVKALERVFPTLTMPYAQFEMMRGIAYRARALLAQRDALKAERDEAIRERDTLVKDRDAAREQCSLMTAKRDAERTQRQEASADLFCMTQARDGLKECMREVRMLLFPEFGDAHVPHTRIVERVKKLLNTGVSAALTEFGFGDYQLAPVERVRQMGTALVEARGQVADLRIITAERDTLAARVKELEDRPRGAAIIPADVPFKGCWNDHETVKKYRGALEAEVANLRKELASVKAERDAVVGEKENGDKKDGHFLSQIRDALGRYVYGRDLVFAIKAMKEELESVTRHMNEWRKLCEDIREAAGARERESVIYAVKALRRDAEFGRAALEHANALGIDTNKELGQQYRALRRDAEAWRASRSGGASGGNVQHLGVCFPAGGSPVMIPASMSCDPNRVFDYTAGYLAGKGAK